jgi:hypothetical protein
MDKWYYSEESAEKGPVTLKQLESTQKGPITLELLKSMLQTGKLDRSTFVLGPNMKNWVKARQVPGLVPQVENWTTESDPEKTVLKTEYPDKYEELNPKKTKKLKAHTKYPALIFVIKVYNFLGKLSIFIFLLFFIFFPTNTENQSAAIGNWFLTQLIILICGVTLFFWAQAIRLFMDIESTLREIRDRL